MICQVFKFRWGKKNDHPFKTWFEILVAAPESTGEVPHKINMWPSVRSMQKPSTRCPGLLRETGADGCKMWRMGQNQILGQEMFSINHPFVGVPNFDPYPTMWVCPKIWMFHTKHDCTPPSSRDDPERLGVGKLFSKNWCMLIWWRVIFWAHWSPLVPFLWPIPMWPSFFVFKVDVSTHTHTTCSSNLPFWCHQTPFAAKFPKL